MLDEARGGDDAFATLLDLLERLHHNDQKRSVTDAIDDVVSQHAEIYEEAPQAYKDISQVILDLENFGLIDVIATLKPVITYKTRRR